MDLQAWENIIILAAEGHSNEATQMLDQLRASDDVWEIGLQLFFNSSHDKVKFVALSLVSL
jgi:hypothetical protein